MLITATFIGQDSLGYESGKPYLLEIEGLSISRTDGSGKTAYGSFPAFFKNWADVKVTG
jgi:hypothetical protein